MNQAELKLEIFRQIDGLSDQNLIELQKKIFQIQAVSNKNKRNKSVVSKHFKLKKLIKKPIPVNKINLLSRNEIYER